MYSSSSMTSLEIEEATQHEINRPEPAILQAIRQLQIQQQIIHDFFDGRMPQATCSICQQSVSQLTIIPFCCQEHAYCHTCISAIVDNSLKEFKPIRCPDQSCMKELTQQSPYYHHQLSQQRKDQYAKIIRNRQILTNPKIRLCSKPDCDGHYQTTSIKFQCNVCKQQYCQKCLEAQHTGSCDRLVARGIQRRFGFRKCPQCRMVVSRNEGCDHMTCLCSHQFCYKCGQSYIKGSHQCTKPAYLKGMDAFRWEVQNKPSALQTAGLINLNKILYLLQPDEEKSEIGRLIHIFLFTLLLYPALTLLAVTLGLILPLLYCGIAFILIVAYFIVLPIAEVCHLQLAPARLIRRRGVPKFITRMLMIPLYPINFLFGIKDKSDFFTCQNEIPRAQSLVKIVYFFLVLPLLMKIPPE